MNFAVSSKKKPAHRISRKHCNTIFATSVIYLGRIIDNINKIFFSSFTWGQCISVKKRLCCEQCATNLVGGAFFIALIYADCDLYETQVRQQYEALEKARLIRPFAAKEVLHLIDALVGIIDFDVSVPLKELDIILKQLS